MAPILSRVSSNFGFGKRTAAAATAPAPGIEDVFQTYLYTGNGSTQTITNGIDLSGEGGLVWIKNRNSTSFGNVNHALHDSARGVTNSLASNLTSQQFNQTTGGVTSFGSTGFSLGTYPLYNDNGYTYASWTFRKAAKFFDVVTYTGTGSDQTISHNLGSTPGCIIVKRTDSTNDWYVYHRSLATATENWIRLNNTGTANGAIGQDLWGPPTSTTFKVDTYLGLSTSSATYVAYLFAHDAGGFGDSGNESVVSCGSFTGGGTVDLGWEPQWLLLKGTSTSTDWYIQDAMRGMSVGGNDPYLQPNLSDAEGSANSVEISSTGFSLPAFWGSINGIYIAIRRGPMKTPTDATTVFAVATATQTIDTSNQPPSAGFPADLIYYKGREFAGGDWYSAARLNSGKYLRFNQTSAETTNAGFQFDTQSGWRAAASIEGSASWSFGYFRRAPGFFDVVAYTGDSSNFRTISHNLKTAPELMIVKRRNGVQAWAVYYGDPTDYLYLNSSNATADDIWFWYDTAPTPSVFTVGNDPAVNTSGGTYIAYLFATCPGVSKVFNYTGTGTTKQIDCGFTNGARFVLIKRTDSTGDWYVWDSARGIISGNDPYLLLNSTAAEVTNTDYIDPYSAGFEISSTAPAAINANGGSYIGLAIA